MSFKIASLIAEIGANTSGLESGLNRAQSLLESSAKKMEKLGGSLSEKLFDPARAIEAGSQFAAIAGGAASALTAIGLIGSQYYTLAKDSAQLEYSRQKFDALSQSIGSTADYLLNDMRRATRGLYSDAQLVEQGGAMMALGLANTHDEAVRLTRVAGALNMNMDQLVLTLTNQTTRRFDSLGVSTDGFKERLKVLEQQGYDTDRAFKEAFLQQAEEQIIRVGDVADSGYGSFMRFESSWDNFSNSMKRGRETALIPYLRTFTQLFDIQTRAYELMESGENTYYRSAAAQAAVESGRMMGVASGRVGDDIYFGTSKASIGLQGVANDMGVVLDVGLKLSDMTEEYSGKLADLNMKLQDASQKYGEYGQKTNEVRGQIQSLQAAHATAFETMALKTLEQKEASEMMMLDYARASGLITQQGYDQAVMMDALSQAYVDGRMNASSYASAVNQIASMVGRLNGMSAKVFIDIFIREHGSSSYMPGSYAGGISVPRSESQSRGSNNAGKTIAMHAIGGPVSAGNMYQVNENGAPEMLTIGGKDYLMMGLQSGYVHAANTERGGQRGGDISAIVAAIPSATDNAKALARELMKFWS